MTKRPTMNREQFEQQIIQRAATDAAFRQQLINAPRMTLSRELGSPLPTGINFTVLEETSSSYYLVLPPTGVATGAELSDAELGVAAGGNQAGAFTENVGTYCKGPGASDAASRQCL